MVDLGDSIHILSAFRTIPHISSQLPFGQSYLYTCPNPPFSAKWSVSSLFLRDDRFSQYGKLAPKSKADYAFIQHMIHHLDDNDTMAVVAPHGVLFR